jgi:hypothetical protein
MQEILKSSNPEILKSSNPQILKSSNLQISIINPQSALPISFKIVILRHILLYEERNYVYRQSI